MAQASSSSASPPTDVLYLAGPTYFKVLYSKQYGKIVYIFGERHTAGTKCPEDYEPSINLIEWFEELFDGAGSKRIDVFSETAYYPLAKKKFERRRVDDVSSLTELEKLLRKECYTSQLRKDECRFKNVYFHLSDIRQNSETFRVIYYLQQIYEAASQEPSALVEDLKLILEYDDYDFVLSTDNMKQELQRVLEQLKVAKQMSNIPEKYKAAANLINSDLSAIMNLYLPSLTKNALRQFLKIYSDMRKIDPNKLKQFEREFGAVVNNYDAPGYLDRAESIVNKYTTSDKQQIDYKSLRKQFQNYLDHIAETSFLRIMDTYLLSRMFRRFRDGHEPTNIIVLAGRAHSEYYYAFLKKLGFEDMYVNNIHTISEDEIQRLAQAEFEEDYDHRYKRKYKEDYEAKKAKKMEELIERMRSTPCIKLSGFAPKFL